MRITNVLSILAVLVFIAVGARSQDTVYVMHNTVPQLNKHKFVPNPLVIGPWTNSQYRMRIGVEGTVDLTVPLPDFLPDSISGPQGNLVFVNIGMRYNQRIKDWISFYISPFIAVRSGTELGTILFEGVNTLVGGETGVIFKLMERPKHKLSGAFMISNYDATIINVGQFVKDVIDRDPNASITQDAPALAIGLGASYAVGFTPVTGLTATGELQYGESISRGDESFRFRLGAAVDFNWESKGVPLGISLAYLMRSTIDFIYVDDDIGHSYTGKIAYTASPNFVLGFELTGSILPVISIPDKVRSMGVMANINYYFN